MESEVLLETRKSALVGFHVCIMLKVHKTNFKIPPSEMQWMLLCFDDVFMIHFTSQTIPTKVPTSVSQTGGIISVVHSHSVPENTSHPTLPCCSPALLILKSHLFKAFPCVVLLDIMRAGQGHHFPSRG